MVLLGFINTWSDLNRFFTFIFTSMVLNLSNIFKRKSEAEKTAILNKKAKIKCYNDDYTYSLETINKFAGNGYNEASIILGKNITECQLKVLMDRLEKDGYVLELKRSETKDDFNKPFLLEVKW